MGVVGNVQVILVAEVGTIAARDRNSVVVEGIRIVMSGLDVAAGGGAQGIQLGGELSLGFDERATVIAHGLVTGIGVLRHNGIYGRNQD